MKENKGKEEKSIELKESIQSKAREKGAVLYLNT